MKRSEILLKLQRYYSIKHVMVEAGYITKDEFMDSVLQLVEELGMKPPLTKRCPVLLTDKHVWEPENETK